MEASLDQRRKLIELGRRRALPQRRAGAEIDLAPAAVPAALQPRPIVETHGALAAGDGQAVAIIGARLADLAGQADLDFAGGEMSFDRRLCGLAVGGIGDAGAADGER